MPPQNAALDHVFTALADPTRRAILNRLAQGETRVTALAEPFEVSLNAISKHIRMLERGGLVQRRRAGREHWISARPGALDRAARWISEQTAFWNTRLDALEALLDEEDQQTKGPVS